MSPESVLNTVEQAMQMTLVLILVLLLPALVTGLVVSMFQAATQINELTLSFIPKLIVTLVTILLAGPWMIRLMMEFTRRLVEDIPFLIG